MKKFETDSKLVNDKKLSFIYDADRLKKYLDISDYHPRRGAIDSFVEMCSEELMAQDISEYLHSYGIDKDLALKLAIDISSSYKYEFREIRELTEPYD